LHQRKKCAKMEARTGNRYSKEVNHMGFFDTFKEKATDLAQAGVAQSKRLAEIAKLKTANMGEEDTIKKAYLEIGKLYYAERGFAPEGAYAAACEKITAAKAAIEANNDRIAELKDKDDDDDDFRVVADPVVVAAPEVTVTEADFEEVEPIVEETTDGEEPPKIEE